MRYFTFFFEIKYITPSVIESRRGSISISQHKFPSAEDVKKEIINKPQYQENYYSPEITGMFEYDTEQDLLDFCEGM